jgi:hypothetical protein
VTLGFAGVEEECVALNVSTTSSIQVRVVCGGAATAREGGMKEPTTFHASATPIPVGAERPVLSKSIPARRQTASVCASGGTPERAFRARTCCVAVMVRAMMSTSSVSVLGFL